MVDSMLTECPLGRSDHATLCFRFVCYAPYSGASDEGIRVFTDYNQLATLISAIDWAFLGEQTPNVAWQTFANCFTSVVANASDSKPPRMQKQLNHTK